MGLLNFVLPGYERMSVTKVSWSALLEHVTMSLNSENSENRPYVSRALKISKKNTKSKAIP
jgi:hypothetical protein